MGSPLRRRDLILGMALSIVLGLTKPGYVPLVGFVLLAPVERFGSRARRAAWAGVCVATCLIATLLWALAIRPTYPPLTETALVAPSSPLRLLVEHPLVFGGLAMSQLRRAPALAAEYVGKLGWIDTRLPPPLLVAIFAVIAAAALTSGGSSSVWNTRRRLLLAGVLLANVAWILALLYVFFTSPGAPAIASVQGRYFVPLGPLAFLLLSNRRWHVDWDRWRPGLAAWSAGSLAAARVARRTLLRMRPASVEAS